MADYTTSRTNERFIFKRVRWAGFSTADAEIATYTQFTGGSVSYGLYSALKVSGSFDFVGEAPDATDLLRVYYQFTDANGETSELHALGTFLVGADSVKNSPNGATLLKSGTVNGYSTLKVLQDRLCGLPLTVSAGTNPITYAAQICEGLGLRVNYPKGNAYTLAAPHTFEPNDSMLEVVNWLCANNSPQYQGATVDGYGVVQLREYEEPNAKTPTAVFRDDAQSIMLPEVEEANDWQASPNVARLYYESDAGAMWAVARALSGSRASLANRGGREITLYEQIDECAGLAELQALAVSRVKDKSAEIERVSLTHGFMPISTGDSVAVEYANRTWQGTVQNMEVTLAPSAQTKTQLRKYISASLEIDIDGGVLWGVV